ncbi:hypothetical protein D3C74_317740 [compost metagenome]
MTGDRAGSLGCSLVKTCTTSRDVRHTWLDSGASSGGAGGQPVTPVQQSSRRTDAHAQLHQSHDRRGDRGHRARRAGLRLRAQTPGPRGARGDREDAGHRASDPGRCVGLPQPAVPHARPVRGDRVRSPVPAAGGRRHQGRSVGRVPRGGRILGVHRLPGDVARGARERARRVGRDQTRRPCRGGPRGLPHRRRGGDVRRGFRAARCGRGRPAVPRGRAGCARGVRVRGCSARDVHARGWRDLHQGGGRRCRPGGQGRAGDPRG